MVQKTPLVSVIMPAHNAADYIEASIQSVLKQTYHAIELIVIDDASTDETTSIVDRFIDTDSRVNLLLSDDNVGVAETRNLGVRAAQGKYIAFLDSDDQWESEKVERQVDFMQEHHAQFSYGSYDVVDETGKKTGTRLISEPQLSYRQLLGGNRIGLLTAMVETQIIQEHPFPDIDHEDYACWLSILRDGVVAYRFAEEPTARYLVRSNSVSSNKFQAAKWTWQILRREGLNVFTASYYFARYALMVVTGHR